MSSQLAGANIVEVAVTLPVLGRFHYRVPSHLVDRARVGARVLVRFGSRKVTGVVVRTNVAPPDEVTPVELSDVLDTEPALPPELVELCVWIADYYEAPVGEVLRAALPAGSGVAARAVYALTDAGRQLVEGQGPALPTKQRALLGQLAKRELPVTGTSAVVKRQLDALIERGLVEQRELRSEARTKLKRERVARLVVTLEAARVAAARAPKRLEVIEALADGQGMPVTELQRRVPRSAGVIRELVKAQIVEVTEQEMALEAIAIGAGMATSAPPRLTEEQAKAVAEIVGAMEGTAGTGTMERTGSGSGIGGSGSGSGSGVGERGSGIGGSGSGSFAFAADTAFGSESGSESESESG
ncbi:MAG: hypothetical protein AB7R00_31310, partial [Kofleriaceae bacterium]